MRDPTISARVNIVAIRPGECLTVYLYANDGIKQVELRVTLSGEVQVFFDEGVEIMPFTKWYDIS